MHHNPNSKGSSAQRCSKGLTRNEFRVKFPRPSKSSRGRWNRTVSVEEREASLAPFRRDLAKQAAVGVNPIYRNGIVDRRAAFEAWSKRAKAWDLAHPVKPRAKAA